MFNSYMLITRGYLVLPLLPRPWRLTRPRRLSAAPAKQPQYGEVDEALSLIQKESERPVFLHSRHRSPVGRWDP